MSVPALKWAWRQQVRGSAKTVLLCLAWGATEQWTIQISAATISDECGLSERTIRTDLGYLRAAGFIENAETDEFQNSKSRYAVPIYQLRGAKSAPDTTTTVVQGAKSAPLKSAFSKAIDAAFERGVKVGKKLATKQVHTKS